MRLPGVLLSALAAVLLCAGGFAAERGKTEAELRQIRQQIERVSQQVRRDAAQRDKLARDLAAAEGSVARARGELEQLRRQRAEREAARAELAKQKREREASLARGRELLAAQLRAAYLMGPREPLRLALSQQDPGRMGRIFAYYGYFGRERAAGIEKINEDIAVIEAADAKIAEQEAELARLEAARKGQLEDLEDARRQRSKVLAELRNEARDRERQLKRLQAQQAGLEKLLKDLDRALKDFPVDPRDGFAKLRGRLSWPAPGKLVARFGDTRAGGVKWNGMLIAAPRGTPVKAVHAGRVAYSDWLPGLGQLVIIDHGGGYLSLYGHNEQLLKAAGATVAAGDTIATVGDSGGRPQPEVYFEIRRGGRPIDPAPFLRGRTPPASP